MRNSRNGHRHGGMRHPPCAGSWDADPKISHSNLGGCNMGMLWRGNNWFSIDESYWIPSMIWSDCHIELAIHMFSYQASFSNLIAFSFRHYENLTNANPFDLVIKS
mmetsp:Transcript_26540/g.63672  ORF Transcript_26540/g.63672 Transcript_26540/m.63672 type:complete len:106 (-) Transcript_26540:151-468(-)